VTVWLLVPETLGVTLLVPVPEIVKLGDTVLLAVVDGKAVRELDGVTASKLNIITG
jgi:hypothetical protein